MQISDPQDPEEPGQRSVRADIAIMQTPARQRTTRCRYGCERGVLPQGLPTDSADEVRGLDPEQLARRSVPPSTMSLLGPLRHLAEVERDWRNWILPGDPAPKLHGTGDADSEGAAAEQALVDDAFADLAREQAATDAVLAEHPDLGERVGKDGIAVRELWVHRIEEYARHCGHADLLRECIDGRVGQ
jgi:hypothetical protein